MAIFKSILLRNYLFRILVATSVIATEMLVFYYFKDSAGNLAITDGMTFAEYMREQGGIRFIFSSYTQKVVFLALLSYPFLILVLWAKESHLVRNLKTNFLDVPKFTLLANFTSFFCLLIFYITVNNPRELIDNPLGLQGIFYTFFPLVWSVYLYSALNFIFPISIFLNFLNKNKLLVFVFIIFSIASVNPSVNPIHLTSVIDFWSDLLLKPTVMLAKAISNVFGFSMEVYKAQGESYPIFGTSQFNVVITPDCSGYEGITLALAFLIMYCYYQRSTLAMPRALLILPFSVLAMFILNAFRLVILIFLGNFYSPELALNGFHSVGGWLNLLIVLMLSIWILSNTLFTLRINDLKQRPVLRLRENFLLLPLAILIISSLVIKAFTADFQWLYPIPVAVVGWFLFTKRKKLEYILYPPSLKSILMGILIFIAWIYLIPADDSKSMNFYNEILLKPIGISLLWLLSRIIGAVIIVPIAEELAFRGFIQPHLSLFFEESLIWSRLNIVIGRKKLLCTVSSLIVTSILFGILHSTIIAGTIAGFGYGIIFLQRKRLIDPIMAHGVTNGLLGVYIIYYGNWSYW